MARLKRLNNGVFSLRRGLLTCLAAIGCISAFAQVTDVLLREQHQNHWVLLVGVIVLALVGLIRTFQPFQHKLAIRSAFINVKTQYEQLDKGFGIGPILFLQVFVSCISVSFGVYLFKPFDFKFTMTEGLRVYLLILLAVCIAYALKYFIHYIVGLVLQSEMLANLMVVGLSRLMYSFGLFIFPLLLVWHYVPDFTIKYYVENALLIALAIFLIWRLVKSFFVYYSYFPFAKIYIIIYLCTLEITPLLLVGYFVVN